MLLAHLLLLTVLSAEPPHDPSFDAAVDAFVAALSKGDVARLMESWSEQSPTRTAARSRLARLAMVHASRTVTPTLERERHVVHLDLRNTAGVLVEQYDVAFRLEDGRWRTWSLAACERAEPLPRARELLHVASEQVQSGEVDAAFDSFTRLIPLADAAGDPPTRAAAERGLGNVAYLRGDMTTAAMFFQRSADTARAVGDRAGLAMALDRLAMLDQIAGNLELAESRLSEALAIFRERGERVFTAYMINALANIRSARSDYEGAKALYEDALKLQEEAGDVVGTSTALVNLGINARARGQYRESAALLQRTLELSRSVDDTGGMAHAWSNLGTTYAMQGKLAEAVQAFERGLELHERLAAVGPIVNTLGELGDTYRLLGNADQARVHYEKALAQAEKVGYRAAIATGLHNLGQLRRDGGDPRGAIALYERALAIDTELGQRAEVGRDLQNIGHAHLLAGDRPAARRAFEKSLAIAEEIGARELLTASLRLLGQATDDAAEAIALSQRSLVVATELGLPEHLWQSHLALGRAYRRAGRLSDARAEVQRAVTIVEELRRGIPGEEIARQQAFENKVEPYHDMTAILVQQGDEAAAFEHAERARARVLLDVLHHGRPDIDGTIGEEERAREASLAAALAKINREYRDTLVAGKPTRDVSARLHAARLAYDAFLTSLYAAHPQLRNERGDVTPLRAYDLAALLAAGAADAFLEFVVTTERTYLFAVTAKGDGIDLRVHTIDIPRRELEADVLRFRELLASRNLTYGVQARALYDRLLRPAAAQLRGKTTIGIVPDGVLWELPFQALQPADGEFLLDRHALYSAPSLTVLREMTARSRAKERASMRLLALGNPLLPGDGAARPGSVWRDTGLAPLPHTEDEIRAIASLYGARNSRVRLRAEAREEAVKTEAGTADVLHFATHGILDDQNALYSRLVLSPPATAAEDGLLEAREIMRLDLRAQLAVLSACETARGRVSTGEGVIGMSWALFVAGVPATVVSQWKVDSSSTAALMIEFHRNLRGSARSKAEALRRAALATRANRAYRHPFHWAPFVVVGSAR